MTQVYVVDAIMGAGKTSAAINFVNESPAEDKFAFLTPYLDECKRIIKSCNDKRFVQPEEVRGSKVNDLRAQISKGQNVTSTHSLFSKYTPDIIEMVKEKEYTLILDEAYNVTQTVTLKDKSDFEYLVRKKDVEVDVETGRAIWVNEAEEGSASMLDLIEKVKSGSVYCYDNNKIVIWIFPFEILQAFKRIYILTYMFSAQPQRAYFDVFGFKYEYIGVKLGGDGEFRFCSRDETYKNPINYREMIHILENPKLNAIGAKRFSLSSGWADRDKKGNDGKGIAQLGRNVANVQRNIFNCSQKDFLWTFFKCGEGFMADKNTRCRSIPWNKRATNAYRNCQYLAYCINLYQHPDAYNYFLSKGCKLDSSRWALSEMLQWIWRSAIRDGKEIWIYIPSARMRKLLKDWMSYKPREPLFQGMRSATIVRLLYLATFLTSQGILKDGDKFIRKQELQDYLLVSRTDQYRFWNEVSANGIAYEKNDCLYLDAGVFTYGNIDRGRARDKNMEIVKIYRSPLREMYEREESSSVKPLSYLYKLIPYVNGEHGVCCVDPDEEDSDYIDPISISDIADIVGYDRSSAYRLLEIFRGYEVKINGWSTCAARYIPSKDRAGSGDLWGMFVNPNVFRTYRGR